MGRGIRGNGSVTCRKSNPRILRHVHSSNLPTVGNQQTQGSGPAVSVASISSNSSLSKIAPPLSAGLDIGFAAALISKPPQFGLADFSLSPPIDSTIQGAIAVSSPTLAGSGGLFEGNLPKYLTCRDWRHLFRPLPALSNQW